jgi:hypothetical protein
MVFIFPGGEKFGSLHTAGFFGACGLRWGNHQAKALQQHNRALCRSPPYQLTTFTLTVLHVYVAARILQAAILKRAIYEDTLIQNQVLILEDFVFMSIHRLARATTQRGYAVRSHRASAGSW